MFSQSDRAGSVALVEVPTRRWEQRIAAARRVLRRLSYRARPLVKITDPPTGVRVDRDVEVRARDGVVLSVKEIRHV